MSDYKYYCEADGCDNEVLPPELCCNGFDCGCRGEPLEPMVCSEACYYIVYYPHLKPHEE
jgi:hypothetical protein